MSRFEHMRVVDRGEVGVSEETLAFMSKHGWELVTVLPPLHKYTDSYWKRPVPAPETTNDHDA